MKVLLTAITFLSLLINSAVDNKCRCVPTPQESTRDGANQTITIIERKQYRGVKGIVRAPNGELLSNVLVEVFDEPEHLLLPYPESEKKKKAQRRLTTCVTGPDGSFCFAGLAAGKYEIRFSKDSGWNHTQIYIEVAPADHKATNRALSVRLELGT
jgi:hypothetical protein